MEPEHHRDALDVERLRQPRVPVDIHLRQDKGPALLIGEALQQRPERPARPAPRRPEIDHDGLPLRALDYRRFEIPVSGVNDPLAHITVRGLAPTPRIMFSMPATVVAELPARNRRGGAEYNLTRAPIRESHQRCGGA
jgi:hypothetical protein